jgi:hypothetical protein
MRIGGYAMSLFTAPVFSARFKSGRTSGHIIIPERSTTKMGQTGRDLARDLTRLAGFPEPPHSQVYGS